MAHDSTTGKIFVNASSGISFEEVRTILGAQYGEELCTHANINPWSLKKPVRQPHTSQPANWWKAQSGNYGIAPYSLGTGSTALTNLRTYNYNGAMNGWVYEAPRSVATYSEWHRILDFNGYWHYADHPWSGWSMMGTNVIKGNDALFALDNVVVSAAGLESINYDAIQLSLSSPSITKYLSQCYFGVAVFTAGGTRVGLATCQHPMGYTDSSATDPDIAWEVVFDGATVTNNWSPGNYVAYPFFWIKDGSGAMPSNWTSIQEGEIFTIPFVSPKQFTVVNDVTPGSSVYITGSAGVDSYSPLEIGYSVLLGVGSVNHQILSLVMNLKQVGRPVGESPRNTSETGEKTIYDSSNDQQFDPSYEYTSGETELVDLNGGDPGAIPGIPISVSADSRFLTRPGYAIDVIMSLYSATGHTVSLTQRINVQP